VTRESSPWGPHIRWPHCFLVSRGSPPERFTYGSAPKDWPQEQPAGQKPMTGDSPSLRNTVSSSPRPTSQISSQKANYSGVNEDQNTRPHGGSRAMSQDPQSDVDSNRSETRTNFQSILGDGNAPRREKDNKLLSE